MGVPDDTSNIRSVLLLPDISRTQPGSHMVVDLRVVVGEHVLAWGGSSFCAAYVSTAGSL